MYHNKEKMETRCLPTSEVRIVGDDTNPKIEGYAALFGVWADIGGWFRESIKPGAFRKTIKEGDVRALWNHNPDYVLGRNISKTLRIYEDSKGLAYEVNPPNTTWAKDLMESMRRSDVNQSSFGFTVNKEEIDPAKDERVLVDVSLFDVSVVTYPAYPTTTAQVRSQFNKTVTTSTTGTLPITTDATIFDPSTTSWSGLNGTHNPPGFSELDRVVRKIIRKEELTEEDWRVLAVHYPDLSPPAASHAETPTPPAASHAVVDTRKGDPVADLLIRTAQMLGQTIRKEEQTV